MVEMQILQALLSALLSTVLKNRMKITLENDQPAFCSQ